MALRVKTLTDITSRMQTLRTRLERQHREMERVESWRHLDVEALTEEVWGDTDENAPRRTIIPTHIAATTDTVVAFLSSKEPRITTAPKDPRRLADIDAANANERIHTSLWYTLDRDRNVSMLREASEYDVHRGVIVFKALWLSPEERGEKRETVRPEIDMSAYGIESAPYEQVIEPGGLPPMVQVLDPLDCFWTLGRDDRVIEFAHEQTFTWDIVCDMFPDIYDHPDFKQRLASSTTVIQGGPCKVVDYWNETDNIVLIDNRIYKQVPHGYGEVPVVVELVDPRIIRNESGPPQKIGSPFCADMVDSLTHMAWAESASASHLAEVAIATLVHRGLDPSLSPYWAVKEGERNPSYNAIVNTGAGGRIMPLFYNEELRYLNPPPIVDVLELFKQSRVRDASLVSFPESILSGAQTADVSGYAYAQMKQAAMARVEGPRMALDRALTRLMNLLNRIIIANWDYLDDEPMVLVGRNEKGVEAPVEVRLEDFQNAGPVRVEVQPEIPINKEQEEALILQKVSVGLLSRLTAMDMLGDVQDPSAEMKRIAFETFQQQDPATMAALARSYMQENDLLPVQPRQQPVSAMPPDGGMTGGPVAPQQSVPPDPASGGMPETGAEMNPMMMMQMMRSRGGM